MKSDTILLSDNLKLYIECKDYSVSMESFNLMINEELDMLITSPQPKIEQLKKYYESDDYISHTDSKRSFFDRIYQLVKSYSISKKVKLIYGLDSFMLSEKKVLDIGCGTGDFLKVCKDQGWNVTGVEPNAKAKNLAQIKTNTIIESDLSELVGEQFNCITMWHVLEHVPNLTDYIGQLKNMLKPNGTLIVAVPNFKSYDASYYGKFWAAFDVPRHLWHFSQNAIIRLFGNENMTLIKTVAMRFDSFYVSLLSEKYKHKKSKPLRAFYIGLKSNLKASKTKEYSSLIYILRNTK